MYRPCSARALYWRAIRRVERRAATVRALRPLADSGPAHCPACQHADVLLREACRLANRLAMLP